MRRTRRNRNSVSIVRFRAANVVPALAAVLALGVVATPPAYRILYSFQCGTDGNQPNGGLIRDTAGNLYGTTAGGGNFACGSFGCGTVFKLDATGTETVLYAFTGPPTDGENPSAGSLVSNEAGNLYGTTSFGGVQGSGTAFEVAPNGRERVLHNFIGQPLDGGDPSGLIRDTAGNLYGTTVEGGSYFFGTVFKLTPDGNERFLHDFPTNRWDGAFPYAGLVLDSAGNVYGTTTEGGTRGRGMVFELSATGVETPLHEFGSVPEDGAYPIGSLLFDSAHNLYGTTFLGGTGTCTDGSKSGCGVVFRLSATGNESVLYRFAGAPDGASPTAGVVRDTAGNIYGTTALGGDTSCNPPYGCGIVFKLDSAGAETILHTFAGPPDAALPYAGLLRDSAGNLYGTTSNGGTDNCGTLFKYTP